MFCSMNTIALIFYLNCHDPRLTASVHLARESELDIFEASRQTRSGILHLYPPTPSAAVMDTTFITIHGKFAPKPWLLAPELCPEYTKNVQSVNANASSQIFPTMPPFATPLIASKWC